MSGGCAVTARRSGNASSVTVQRLLPLPGGSATRLARRSRRGSVRCRWSAIAPMTTSVPTQYGHRQVWVKGQCARSGDRLWQRGDRPARAQLSEREVVVFDPLHYLALLEQKNSGRWIRAAPLAGWRLPESFVQLRRLLEASLAGSMAAVSMCRCSACWRPSTS